MCTIPDMLGQEAVIYSAVCTIPDMLGQEAVIYSAVCVQYLIC